jgi:transposase InsO family protein
MTQMVQAGLQVLRHGKICYVGQLRQMHQKLELHSDDGDMQIITPEVFRSEVVTGDIQMLAPDGKGIFHPVSSNWRERETVRSKAERNRRVQILRFVEDECKSGKLLKNVLCELQTFCTAKNLGESPSERTLRNWRSLSKGHESMLSPAWSQCGNRLQGPDDLLLETLTKVVNTCILGNDRFTLTAGWRFVEALYDECWRKKMGARQIPRHSIRKLKTFVRAMPWAETNKLRLDGRTYRALTRSAIYRNTADTYWECVEMDATVLDVLVRDEKGNEIGRPVLYVAIDVATGYVVGLHLTIQKPSTLPFVECLRYMYFPKPEGFDAQYGIKNRIEVYGKPILLKVDNGSDFIGKAAVEVVWQLHGDTARCTPYKPQEKPHVERVNGSIRSYVLTLAGATTSSVTGQKRTPPKNEKLHTLEELKGLILRFIYDRYHLQVNELRSIKSRDAVAPVDIWKKMLETFPQPVPVPREEFEKALCFKKENRKLSHEGITFDTWKYHSEALKEMYAQFGPQSYDFLYSELDVSTIYVKQPNSEETVEAFEKDLQDTSIDRATAKVIRARIAADGKVLNRRTFDHTLAEYRILEKVAKSSRKRAEAARIDDMVTTAAKQIKLTVPRQQTIPDAPALNSDLTWPVSIESNTPRGRKSGAKK